MVIYVVIILLASGLIYSEVKRRKEKELLVAKLSSENSHLGVGEITREVDPVTQSEKDIVSEGVDMEKELRYLAEKKAEYSKILNPSHSEKDYDELSSQVQEQLILKRKYDDAF